MRKKGIRKAISFIVRKLELFDKAGFIEALRNKHMEKKLLAENQRLDSAPPVSFDWPEKIRKPYIGLVKSEIGNFAYWPKFERFLKVNSIPYDFFDIKKSTFASEAMKFDVIVWRTPSSYSEQWEATDKVEYIQDFLKKMILPNKESLWFYEDKIREQWLFDYYNLPSIKTFISYSKEEIHTYIEKANYPLVLKDRTCASSDGVVLVRTKHQAKAKCSAIFYDGLRLSEKYIRQKNYVLFQEFVPNKGFDLRVIIVGDSYFGYYRFPRKGDYRASGSGLVEKKSIPEEVLRIAKRTYTCFPRSKLLAVDFLQDTRDDLYYIIETSIFINVETCEQLMVGGIPGRYIEKNGKFVFEQGRFWVQELMLVELMKDWIEIQNKSAVFKKQGDASSLESNHILSGQGFYR